MVICLHSTTSWFGLWSTFARTTFMLRSSQSDSARTDTCFSVNLRYPETYVSTTFFLFFFGQSPYLLPSHTRPFFLGFPILSFPPLFPPKFINAKQEVFHVLKCMCQTFFDIKMNYARKSYQIPRVNETLHCFYARPVRAALYKIIFQAKKRPLEFWNGSMV